MNLPRPFLLLGVSLALPSIGMSSEVPANAHGLPVVTEIELYRKLVEAEPNKAMVELEAFIPGIDLDVKYATADNFMKEPLYPVAKAFLRKPAAEALKKAQQDFEKFGLGLRIFDGYRPYRVTVRMWDRYQRPGFVANPKKGSLHNRGCAVDVTLVWLKNGEALPMPTGYDDFTKQAHRDFADLPDGVIENRKLLREVMDRHGFKMLSSEWWHFDFRGWQDFELMDISLEELANELDREKPNKPRE